MNPSNYKEERHMFQKEDIRVYLDEKNIPYEWFDHKAVFTIEEMMGMMRLTRC